MPSLLHTVSRMRIALGTFVAVEAEAPTREQTERGIFRAFAAIAQVDRLMHPFRDGSDLAMLGRQPPGVSLEIHPWTWEVLDLSRRLAEWSKGTFDPCLGSAPGRMSDIDLTCRNQVIAHAPVHIDLGGIAKGFAIDRAIDAVRSAGCEGALVNAGGDIAAFGHRIHPVVRITPDGEGCLIELTDAAVATSDTGQLNRPTEHRGYYHGADRRRRVTGSVTVMARSAAVADALTKCALAGEPERAMLEAFGAKVLERQAQPQVESGEVFVEVEPLIVGFEDQMRGHV
jgi:thiamine biosynthesis lipoprotein